VRPYGRVPVRTAGLLILFIAITAGFDAHDPSALLSVAEVAADRLLNGDPAGALRALGALECV